MTKDFSQILLQIGLVECHHSFILTMPLSSTFVLNLTSNSIFHRLIKRTNTQSVGTEGEIVLSNDLISLLNFRGDICSRASYGENSHPVSLFTTLYFFSS